MRRAQKMHPPSQRSQFPRLNAQYYSYEVLQQQSLEATS